MSDYKTISDFVKESGISGPRVKNLLADVRPEVKVGRTAGYHPDALKAALINKFGEELNYLGVQGYAANILAGVGNQ